MKDSEFIELLNLYLDHEISAEDAARLEAEVAGSPERRRVYRQYCQMGKACSQLAEHFHGMAPESGQLSARPRRRWNWAASLYTGGLAAAACVAFLAVVRMRTPAPAPATPIVTAPPHADQARVYAAIRPTAQEALAVAESRDLQPVMAVHNLFLNNGGNPAPVSLLTAVGGNDPLAWIARVQAASVPALLGGQVIFTPSPVVISPDSRGPARQSPGLQAPVEMAAFHFQR